MKAMSRPTITIVVARALNGAIGRDGGMPWHLPGDLRHFKAVTMGSAMIMGRKTFDSLPGVLPGRRHIVLTRDPNWSVPGVEVAHSRDEALKLAGSDSVTIIGGSDIFAMFHELADRIELTEVLAEIEGDTFMPDPRRTGCWRETTYEDHLPEGERAGFRFVSLERA
jgi:dihydrofolate reductase